MRSTGWSRWMYSAPLVYSVPSLVLPKDGCFAITEVYYHSVIITVRCNKVRSFRWATNGFRSKRTVSPHFICAKIRKAHVARLDITCLPVRRKTVSSVEGSRPHTFHFSRHPTGIRFNDISLYCHSCEKHCIFKKQVCNRKTELQDYFYEMAQICEKRHGDGPKSPLRNR